MGAELVATIAYSEHLGGHRACGSSRYCEFMSPTAVPESRPVWRRTVGAAFVGAAFVSGASLWLTWTAQQLPTICPAIYPAPASCAPDARFSPAIWGTLVIVGLFAALVAAAATIHHQRKILVLRSLMAALGIAAIIVPLWTLVSSGLSL
ncbi:hypothetical protein J2805_001748 [Arthrobacter oryzae]|nr:hypothetical protein [Arthrobacter oryzae]